MVCCRQISVNSMVTIELCESQQTSELKRQRRNNLLQKEELIRTHLEITRLMKKLDDSEIISADLHTELANVTHNYEHISDDLATANRRIATGNQGFRHELSKSYAQRKAWELERISIHKEHEDRHMLAHKEHEDRHMLAHEENCSVKTVLDSGHLA